MFLVVKQIEGLWKVKGHADLDRDYQCLVGLFTSAGGYIDALLQRFPGSTIQILGDIFLESE